MTTLVESPEQWEALLGRDVFFELPEPWEDGLWSYSGKLEEVERLADGSFYVCGEWGGRLLLENESVAVTVI